MTNLIANMNDRIDELEQLTDWFTIQEKQTSDRLIIFQGLVKQRKEMMFSSSRISSMKQFLKISSKLKRKISYKITKENNIIVKYIIWEDIYE